MLSDSLLVLANMSNVIHFHLSVSTDTIMKNIIFTILSGILLFSCTLNNESKSLNTQDAQLARTKFVNINNNLSYEEYKSLIIEYGKNSKFPDIK